MSILPLMLAQFRSDATTWLAVSFGVLLLAYMMLKPRMGKRDPLERSPASTSLAQQRSIERQMSSLLVELTEMTRAASAGLDTRSARLEALIEDADRRIAALKSLVESTGATPSVPQPARLQVVSEDSPASSPAQSSAPATGAVDLRHAQIYQLADEGRSVHEIAAALGRPSGEVELILALRPRPTARSA
jgi:hypothetical protein